jgi:hypothetical protein
MWGYLASFGPKSEQDNRGVKFSTVSKAQKPHFESLVPSTGLYHPSGRSIGIDGLVRVKSPIGCAKLRVHVRYRASVRAYPT